MSVYLDSSALLRFIFVEPNRLDLTQFDDLISSTLTQLECLRFIDRQRIEKHWDPSLVVEKRQLLNIILHEMTLIPIQPRVMLRAGDTFPTIVGSLDAIHLATALVAQESQFKIELFLSHDRQQSLAAQALGLKVLGI